jgi:hypothetical protein
MSNQVKEESKVEELSLNDFGTTGPVANVEKSTMELSVSSFPQEFFVVNKNPEMLFTGYILQDEDYNSYLVVTSLAELLGSDVKKRSLYLAQTASHENFVLSVAAPTPKNSQNSWVRSGQEAVKKAISKHVRVTRGNDAFRVIESQRPYPKTVWPELALEDMIEQAFSERMITDMEHPLVKELLGS